MRKSLPISCLLIVQDDAPLQHLVEAYLQECAILTIVSHKIPEERKLFDQHSLLFVLIIDHLPHIDALALGQEIRRTSEIPILFLLDTIHQRCIQPWDMIKSDYIVKPFDRDEFFGHVQKMESLIR